MKESELQKRSEMISHLKDQLQEMKAKSSMEGKYIKKCADVAVAQTQKRCMLSEKELKDEIEVNHHLSGCAIIEKDCRQLMMSVVYYWHNCFFCTCGGICF